MSNSIYDIKCNLLNGGQKSLSDYKGKVLLIVNTASKCGFTPQYEDLQKLYEDLSDRGLEILGFPCNQFGSQEKGSSEEISSFCELNYGVSFTMFDKIDVNGDNSHPLFKQLKTEAPGIMGSKNIKWNFTKFLVDQEGKILKRYAPKTSPLAIRSDIEALLD